jgi:hypothetical protein
VLYRRSPISGVDKQPGTTKKDHYARNSRHPAHTVASHDTALGGGCHRTN